MSVGVGQCWCRVLWSERARKREGEDATRREEASRDEMGGQFDTVNRRGLK